MRAGVSKQIGVYTASVIAIFLWGMSYIWNDMLLKIGVEVEYFVFVRVLLAGVMLLMFNLFLGKRLRIARKDIVKFCALALCEPFIYFVCETYGIAFTQSPTYSALIIATTPIFSVAAGILIFRERVSAVNMLGMLVCLGGLVMVTLCTETVGEHFLLGVALLFVAVLAEVGHASCVRALASAYAPSVIVMYQFLIGSLLLLPLFLTKGLAHFEPALYLSWSVWRPVLCLALLCSSIAFSLWAVTIQHLGVAKSSIFLALIPIVTAVLGFVLGQEFLGVKQWAGIAVSCLGLILTQHAGRSFSRGA